MVRREEQPWQSRCTVLLDTRAVAHRGEGPASSFEWACRAAASVGVHLVRARLRRPAADRHRRHVASGSSRSTSGVGDDFEGALLDALAVVDDVGQRPRCGTRAPALRRGGGDGLLVAVLGSLDPEEARLLARLRHGSTAAVAVLLDTATWASPGSTPPGGCR